MVLPFAENLHRCRLAHGLTQGALARKAGMTQASISTLERQLRTPTLGTLARLSTALGIPGPSLLAPVAGASLSRQQVDRIARSILGGQTRSFSDRLSAGEREMADEVGALVIQKLRLCKVSGKDRYARSRWEVLRRAREVKRRFGTNVVQQILHRVDLLLGLGRRS